ncbi:hypothetical protein CEXT_495091 [Caerostris extrusa]|uniref:Uncharacterized protein n=1 Tax=Caerostris extrusa TaxID=172846 RepID=A0AAV4Q5W4_CAEEX|nr:hypothetical protein CEXT_495091 [Caerostris extrusa]
MKTTPLPMKAGGSTIDSRGVDGEGWMWQRSCEMERLICCNLHVQCGRRAPRFGQRRANDSFFSKTTPTVIRPNYRLKTRLRKGFNKVFHADFAFDSSRITPLPSLHPFSSSSPCFFLVGVGKVKGGGFL